MLCLLILVPLTQPADRTLHCGHVQETESEEEPSWELSEDLREFTGDPGDRKAQLLFKQLQQARSRRITAQAVWDNYALLGGSSAAGLSMHAHEI